MPTEREIIDRQYSQLAAQIGRYHEDAKGIEMTDGKAKSAEDCGFLGADDVILTPAMVEAAVAAMPFLMERLERGLISPADGAAALAHAIIRAAEAEMAENRAAEPAKEDTVTLGDMRDSEYGFPGSVSADSSTSRVVWPDVEVDWVVYDIEQPGSTAEDMAAVDASAAETAMWNLLQRKDEALGVATQRVTELEAELGRTRDDRYRMSVMHSTAASANSVLINRLAGAFVALGGMSMQDGLRFVEAENRELHVAEQRALAQHGFDRDQERRG
jgi:hypothetical protein